MQILWITAIALFSVLALRSGAHALILRGLRAPRLAHQRTPADVGLSAHAFRLPVAQDKTLFAWFVPVPSQLLSPAVVVMHGWGANAAMMWPVVPPLHAARFAVLLIDARCHGRSGDETFTSMPRFAEGKDDVFVGRIRRDESQDNTLNMWIVADNLRKGAATNAVQIAEYLAKHQLI